MLKCKDGTITWSWLTKKVSLAMYWVQAQKPLKKKIRTQWYCARQSHWLSNCRIHFGCFICENANHFGKTYIFSTPIQNWVDIECIGIICYISLCQYILPTENYHDSFRRHHWSWRKLHYFMLKILYMVPSSERALRFLNVFLACTIPSPLSRNSSKYFFVSCMSWASLSSSICRNLAKQHWTWLIEAFIPLRAEVSTLVSWHAIFPIDSAASCNFFSMRDLSFGTIVSMCSITWFARSGETTLSFLQMMHIGWSRVRLK